MKNFSFLSRFFFQVKQSGKALFNYAGSPLRSFLVLFLFISFLVPDLSKGLEPDKISAPILIDAVNIKGNSRIEEDAILATVKSQKGEIFDRDTLNKDLRSIYGMGFFEDIQIDVEDSSSGKIVTFIVKEKPSVLARASFETPIRHVINASISGETDFLNSVIENVMLNQPVPTGTGLPGLVTKVKKIAK